MPDAPVSPATSAPGDAAGSTVPAAASSDNEPPPPPLEVVNLAPALTIATSVRDEPAPDVAPARTNPPAAAAPADRTSATRPAAPAAVSRANTNLPGGESRPLIRPIAAQRSAPSAEKPGFWSRANPTRWFDSEKDSVTPGPTEKAAEPAAVEEERNRWHWANPISWFKSGDGRNPDPAESPTGSTTNRIEPAPLPAVAAASNPLSTVPAAAPTPPPAMVPRPALQVASAAEPPRYRYTNPGQPAVGDAKAAESTLSAAYEEHRQGRFAAAAKLYAEAVKLDPSTFDAQLNLAAALMQSGEPRRALGPAETALALRPQSVPARLNLALALDSAGYPADAAVEADRITGARDAAGGATKAERAAAHLLLGNLYSQKLGQPEKARENYLKLLELDPEHPQHLAIRRWLAGRK